MKNDSCQVPLEFSHIFHECYDYYCKSKEDKEPFGLNTGAG